MSAPATSATLVFVHGAQQDGFCWAGLARRLASPARITVAPDLPGHGRNREAPCTSVEALADWLLAWLDRQSGAGATLIGHSLGSLVALEAAARSLGRIDRLVLLGTAVPMPVAPRLLETAATNPTRAMATVNRGSHSLRGWLAAPSPIGLWSPAMNLRLMERQAPALIHADLAACDAYQGGLAAATRVRCPVLLVAGGEDRMTPPAAARDLAGRLADARLVILPGIGHAMMAEAPETLATVIDGFLG